MRLSCIIFFLFVAVLSAVSPYADTINIPDDYQTIQAGIDASSDADTVLVQPGTYYENINFNGKNIVLGSLFITTQDTSYISKTVIDGNENGNVVTFDNSENSSISLIGFKIINGAYGIYCNASIPALTNLIVSNNRKRGIYLYNSSPIMKNMTISSNHPKGFDNGGGGIHCENSKPNMEKLIIKFNYTNHGTGGGGIYCKNSDPILKNVKIIGNFTGESYGGGLRCENSSPILINVEISDNSAYQASGGGMYCENSSNPILKNVTISKNQATIGIGAGLFCCDYSNPSLEDVQIIDNRGVGIACYDNSSPTLFNVTITGNTFVPDAIGGGGIWCRSDSNPVLKNVTISDNYNDIEEGNGGGLYCIGSHPILENVIISGNWVSTHGGGGVSCWGSNPVLKNVIIYNNTAYGGGAGGVYCKESSPKLINVTLSGNEAPEYGVGGLFCYYNSKPILINTILWNNSPGEINMSPDRDSNPIDIVIAYSNIKDGKDGILTNDNATIHWLDGNIDRKPLFVNVENGNFRLLKGSPSIDAGTDYFKFYNDIIVNISPENYIGSAPDMGAYEYNKTTIVIENQELEPTGFSLFQNYPNPFNPMTSISFSMYKSNHVTLHVYNIAGAKVATLADDKFTAGIHNVVWDASGLSSGLYFCNMKVEKTKKVSKMLLLK